MSIRKAYIPLLFILAASLHCAAQSASSLERQAGSKLKDYDFAAASALYRQAYESSSDAAFRNAMIEKIAQCDNGLSMLSFACRPAVVASRTVPARDFFLYYRHIPAERWGRMADGSLAALDPSLGKMFFERTVDGQSDIYTSTRVQDSLWSTPAPLGEAHISPEDEIMPVVSYDGKKLYYSSKGLFGMGGYDLFVSEWDESAGQWGEPQNLGFPFSSVGDDFLYSDTPDGNFSILASNRSCGADSVTIYVLQFNNAPLKTSVTPAQARQIAALKVSRPQTAQPADEEPQPVSYDNPLLQKYAAAMTDYMNLKTSIAGLTARQADQRSRYAAATDDADKGLLQRSLAATEQSMFEQQQKLRQAQDNIQGIEMECLLAGVEIDSGIIAPEPQETEEGQPLPTYEFGRMTAPSYLNVVFEEPEDKIDYTFRVLDESVIADSSDIGDGLVYQIQLLVGSGKVPARQFKGLSPIFEKKQSSGKYVYCVGKFSTYAEAQKALPTVKRYFSSAFIVAFRNGRSMSIANARKAEAEAANRYQVIFSDYPDGIPASILEVIRANCSKDIARRTTDEGKIIYYIAPFDGRSEAESLISKLREAGAKGLSVDNIK